MVNDGLIPAVCEPTLNLEAVRFAIFHVVEESQSGVSACEGAALDVLFSSFYPSFDFTLWRQK